MEKGLTEKPVRFECPDDAVRERIQRAADLVEQSMEVFVAQAIATSVESHEESMFLDRKTGKMVASSYRLESWVVREEYGPFPDVAAS